MREWGIQKHGIKLLKSELQGNQSELVRDEIVDEIVAINHRHEFVLSWSRVVALPSFPLSHPRPFSSLATFYIRRRHRCISKGKLIDISLVSTLSHLKWLVSFFWQAASCCLFVVSMPRPLVVSLAVAPTLTLGHCGCKTDPCPATAHAVTDGNQTQGGAICVGCARVPDRRGVTGAARTSRPHLTRANNPENEIPVCVER